MEFKKLRFSEADKNEMASLLKEYENIDLERKEMVEIYAGDGCGAQCRYSCSTVCAWNCALNCKDSCDATCKDSLQMPGNCDYCAWMAIPWWY